MLIVDPRHPQLSITKQCELLRLNRSSYYYRPTGISDLNEKLMQRIDELYTDHPFLGYRKITAMLNRESYNITAQCCILSKGKCEKSASVNNKLRL